VRATPRTKTLFFLAAFLYVACIFLGRLSLCLLGSFILLYVLYARASFSFATKALEVEAIRDADPHAHTSYPFPVTVDVAVTNHDVAYLHVTDDVPSGCTIVEGEPTMGRMMPPYARLSFGYTCAVDSQQSLTFPYVHVTLRDKRGMFECHEDVECRTTVHVHESPERVKAAEKLASRTFREEAGEESELHIDGDEFHGLREHMYGDRPSSIDWKTSSRTQTLLTKLLEEEESGKFYILLDISHSMRRAYGEQTKLHHGIILSMQLSRILLSHENSVGFVACEEYALSSFVRAGKEKRQYNHILEALSSLPALLPASAMPSDLSYEAPNDEQSASFLSSVIPFLSGVKRRVSSTISSSGIFETIRSISAEEGDVHLVVISDVESNVTQLLSSLRFARRNNHTVTLIAPYTPWYAVDLSELDVDEAERWYTAYLTRTRRLRTLSRTGVNVIEETPEDTIEIIYPQMKRWMR
jgi:uncharacterized protein (DUF58 family)